MFLGENLDRIRGKGVAGSRRVVCDSEVIRVVRCDDRRIRGRRNGGHLGLLVDHASGYGRSAGEMSDHSNGLAGCYLFCSLGGNVWVALVVIGEHFERVPLYASLPINLVQTKLNSIQDCLALISLRTRQRHHDCDLNGRRRFVQQPTNTKNDRSRKKKDSNAYHDERSPAAQAAFPLVGIDLIVHISLYYAGTVLLD